LFKTEIFLIVMNVRFVIYSKLVLSPTCNFTPCCCYRFVLFFVQDRSIFNCHLLQVGVITNLQFYSMLLLLVRAFFVQDRSIFNCHLLQVGVITNLQFYTMLLLLVRAFFVQDRSIFNCYEFTPSLLHVGVIGSYFSLFKTKVFLIVIYSMLVLSPTCNFTPCCCYRFVLFFVQDRSIFNCNECSLFYFSIFIY
jgi:hypothetical protein